MYNANESEGTRDGKNHDTVAMLCRFEAVKFWRNRKAALSVVCEDNWQVYKAAFLKAFFAK